MSKWIKRILAIVVIAFLLFYVFSQPQQSADAVTRFFDSFKAIGTFFTTLFNSLFGQGS
ncbi:MAG: hypothetical protein LBV30_08265 [Propionibacteriaceae bacterium]|jgi:hypothetical protein|nr:hypothetical protein [Propionibacteriaceae bacterium]